MPKSIMSCQDMRISDDKSLEMMIKIFVEMSPIEALISVEPTISCLQSETRLVDGDTLLLGQVIRDDGLGSTGVRNTAESERVSLCSLELYLLCWRS